MSLHLVVILLTETYLGEPLPARTAGGSAAPVYAMVSQSRNGQGTIRCALFAASAGFPSRPEKAMLSAQASLVDGKARCEFPAVPPGSYAMAAFHDENGNGKLDVSVLGGAKEGVAVSGPRPRMGPPRFQEAQFRHGTGPTTLQASLTY